MLIAHLGEERIDPVTRVCRGPNAPVGGNSQSATAVAFPEECDKTEWRRRVLPGHRSCITSLANQGVGVRLLAALAGHSHIFTTQRYIDVNEDHLAQVVESL